MNAEGEAEVREIVRLSKQIQERLIELGFVQDDDSIGNISHHLAELALWGKKLSQEALPAFLSLPLQDKDKLGDLVVDWNHDVFEMKQAMEDMEPALVKLMNFLTTP